MFKKNFSPIPTLLYYVQHDKRKINVKIIVNYNVTLGVTSVGIVLYMTGDV